jgi:two-component system sensor kinase FixL
MLIDASPDGVVGIDAAGIVRTYNSSYALMFGYGPTEAVGKDIKVFLPSSRREPDGFPSSRRKTNRELTGGIRREVMGRRKDKSTFQANLTVGEGVLDCDKISIGILRDATEQKLAMQNRRKGEVLTRSILDVVPEAIVVMDELGVIRTFSPAASRLFGCAPAMAIGKNVEFLIPSSYGRHHDTSLAQFGISEEQRTLGKGRIVVGRCGDGTTFSMELTIEEIDEEGERLFVGFMRDISECQRDLKDAQAELLHASRLSAMGQMTAAIAHELNQPLTAIANYLTAARRALLGAKAQNSKRYVLDMMAEASKQTLRAGSIIRNLRDFLEKHERNRAPEDLNKLVEEATALGFIGAGDNNIKMRLDLAPELPPVMIVRVQIQQVLINLIRNSMEAMMGMRKRELSISTDLAVPGFAQVTVADTGPGLSAEISQRLFQPFVSTKDKGMGIGLSICRSIIDSHGGKISILPDRPVGTAFQILLPLASKLEMDRAA